MALDFFAGCVGGVAGTFVGHPFDTVKVRLQAQDYSSPKYRTAFGAFKFIVKNESPRALFKGLSSPLWGLGAINTIVFGVQGNLLRSMNDPTALSSFAIAGSMAGLAQCVVCSPTELAKTLMQTQGEGESYSKKSSRQFKGLWHCLFKVYRKEGVRGLGRGGLLTAIRDMPAFAGYFASYEWLCRKLDKSNRPELPNSIALFAGGVAGMFSWFLTYPIDVVKTRIQNDTQGKYQGAWDCCVKTYRNEGMTAFGRGLGATMLRAFPTNAATFATVNWVMGLAKKLHYIEDDDTIPLSSLSPPASKYPNHYFPHTHVHSSIITNFPSHHG